VRRDVQPSGRKLSAGEEPLALRRANQLAVYFEQLVAGLDETAFKIALRQEVNGELLGGTEADVLAEAEARKVATTIDKRTATRLAKLIGERARSWMDSEDAVAKGPSTWFEHPAGKRDRVLAPASGGHIYGVVRVSGGV